MLKKNITYVNPFTEQEVTETHYFHISKADLVEMELEEHKDEYTDKDGTKLTGMQAKLTRIVESEDGKAIMSEFKDIIRRAYGKKDGDRFIRSKEVWEEFSSSEAYSQLIFELLTNSSDAAEFINGVIPGNLEHIAAEVRAQAAKAETNGTTAASSETALEQAEPTPEEGTARVEQKGTGAVAHVPPDEAAQLRQQFEDRLKAATPENPITLSRAELTTMDDADLRSGLAEGRYKLS